MLLMPMEANVRTWQACLAGLGALAVPHGNALALPSPAMSAAGQEILKSAYEKIQPDFMAIMRKRADTRKQIDFQLQDEHPDWRMLKALLDRDFLDEMRLRQLSKLVDGGLLDKLPEADRIIYLRAKFPSAPPPVIVTSPKP
jgi:hypothetical protein